MTLDPQSRHIGGMHYDHMPYPGGPSPNFSNPWAATTSAPSTSHLFPTSLGPSPSNYDALPKQQAARTSNVSMAPHSPQSTTVVAPAPNFSNGAYSQPELLGLTQQDLLHAPRNIYDQAYSASTSSSSSYAPTSAPYLASFGQLPQPPVDGARRLSHTSSASNASDAFDALDAGRNMVALSQDLTTPRNIYGRDRESSAESYGFPSSHSSHSSVSDASTGYTSYYGSVASSVSGYSSQSEMDCPSRTLPRPGSLIGANGLPAPQSMMGQFNSKISSSTQKKHKCKVCDKRFTRPSSLQTHMYSHTGEKPYACEVEGCGRHFSVVSNLRRHRKVHKGDRMSDHGSPEGSWMSDK